MKYIKSFRLYESSVIDFPYVFNMVATDIKVYTLPYYMYGNGSNKKVKPDFNIYVLCGSRVSDDDNTTLREVYHNHGILNEVNNVEIFTIILTKAEIIMVMYDYKWEIGYTKSENYLGGIPGSLLHKLPPELFDKIKGRITSASNSRFGSRLSRGIEYSDGYSSNLCLFDCFFG